MSRILALVAVVALLVASGFWLARRAPHEAANVPGTAQAAAPEIPQADLPEGFTALPYLTETRQRAFEKADQVVQDGTDYIAVLDTSKGAITIDLLEDEAPRTVNNFVFLALHRFYNGVPFHRVLDGFMAQTGDPTGTGTGGPGYSFDDEIAKDLSFDERGVVAMANAGPNTNGSQFFITFNAAPWLDGHYSIFGRVLSGGDVLDKLTRIDPQNPSIIARFDDSVQTLLDQGLDLPGGSDRTVGQALADVLGTEPVAGQTISVAGYRGVVGSVGGAKAVGFYPQPDTLDRVVIATRPAQAGERKSP